MNRFVHMDFGWLDQLPPMKAAFGWWSPGWPPRDPLTLRDRRRGSRWFDAEPSLANPSTWERWVQACVSAPVPGLTFADAEDWSWSGNVTTQAPGYQARIFWPESKP